MSEPISAKIDDDDPDRALVQRQLEMLGELAELGLDVARAVAAKARDGSIDVDRAAMAYARVSRAVRLTLMLQSRIVDAGKDRREGAAKALAQAAQGQARLDPAYIHKARVERIVERIAKDEHGDDEEEIYRLVTEAGERLDDEDIYGDVLQRPISELVRLICRDLGLDPDWTRLREEAWAREEVESSGPDASSPACGGGGGPRSGGGGMAALWPATGPP